MRNINVTKYAAKPSARWTKLTDSEKACARVILHVHTGDSAMTKTIAKVILMTLLASAAVACAAAPEKAPITRKG